MSYVVLFLLCVLDVGATLLEQERGIPEWNFLMEMLLKLGPTYFVTIKVLGTSALMACLYYGRQVNQRLHDLGLKTVLVAYGWLALYHSWVLTRPY